MASPRQSGLYGGLYLHAAAAPALASVVKVADVFNLQFETTVEMLECTRKGEGYRRFMPGAGTSRITGDARFQLLATMLAFADNDLSTNPSGALTALSRIAFKLITNDNDIAAGTPLVAYTTGLANQQVIEGFGWMERASLLVPHDDAITQPFEIQVDGEWAFQVTA